MSVGRKFAYLTAVALALLAGPLQAAMTTSSGMGPTSKASVQITVSVAPRMGVQRLAPKESGRPELVCIWSTLPARAYVDGAQADSVDRFSVRTAASNAQTQPSSRACADGADGGGSLTLPTANTRQGNVLLIVAPQ